MDRLRFNSGNSGILESTQEYLGMTWGSYGNDSGMTREYLGDSGRVRDMTISKNAFPVTKASIKQFGNGKHHALRTGKKTLEQIFDTAQDVDPWNLNYFQKCAKAHPCVV